MFEDKIIAAISKEIKGEVKLEVPPDKKLGDFAFPCFTLAKEMKKSPQDIAKELARKLKGLGFVSEVKAMGPYVNIFLKADLAAGTVIRSILDEGLKYGRINKTGKTVVVEYSAPNTNKPIHLGHVRNNVLGMTVSTLLCNAGNTVKKVNWINDRGIHICKSMLAYQKWGQGKEPDKKPDHFVGEFYVMYSKSENDELAAEAQELLRKWEQGDKETLVLWKKMNSWAYDGFKQTYERMGCEFDKWFFESEIYNNARKILDEGLEKGVFGKDEEGAIVAKLEEHGLPDKVVMRADGTSIYVTADIALALEKAKYRFDRSIYVIGSEQKLYMEQLFKMFELLGYKWARGMHHLSYGMVYLPEGKMKSREGKVVDADDLMDDVVALAKEEVKKRYPELKDKEVDERAEAIGMGALKFFMLKIDPVKDMHYDPKESISFEGETGPYCQYTHARIASILRKAGKFDTPKKFDRLEEPEEQALITELGQFPSVVQSAADSLKPHSVVHYLISLCQKFNEFYHKHQVIKADEGLREQRLALLVALKSVLKRGLDLLGIEALERM